MHDWLVEYLYNSRTVVVPMPFTTYTYIADPINVEYVLKTNFSNYPKVKKALYINIMYMFCCDFDFLLYIRERLIILIWKYCWEMGFSILMESFGGNREKPRVSNLLPRILEILVL